MEMESQRIYRVESHADDLWMIFDGKNELVFVGTKQQVEDWLDYQDNLCGRPVVRHAWLSNLRQAFGSPIRRLFECCLLRTSRKS